MSPVGGVFDDRDEAVWRDGYWKGRQDRDAELRAAAQRLIDYLDVREHHEDDTGIRRVDAASRPYVSDLRAALLDQPVPKP